MLQTTLRRRRCIIYAKFDRRTDLCLRRYRITNKENFTRGKQYAKAIGKINTTSEYWQWTENRDKNESTRCPSDKGKDCLRSFYRDLWQKIGKCRSLRSVLPSSNFAVSLSDNAVNTRMWGSPTPDLVFQCSVITMSTHHVWFQWHRKYYKKISQLENNVVGNTSCLWRSNVSSFDWCLECFFFLLRIRLPVFIPTPVKYTGRTVM